MKLNQKGFTIIELAVATAITALIVCAAAMTTFRVLADTSNNNDRMTVIRQVENVGIWISSDARIAEIITAEDLTSPDFLTLGWTDWGYDGPSIYHSVTYSIEDISEGIGKLRRTHQDSGGTNEQTLVADYIYYNLSDPANTSNVSYQMPMLTLKIVSIYGDAQEAREYKTYHRPNFQ